MKPDSIAIANFFIDKKDEEGYDVDLLKLCKLVYIGYGYCLSILGYSILNPKYDRVEAWKYGPVIPNVYYSFRHNGRAIIKEKESVMTEVEDDGQMLFVTPSIQNETVKEILSAVWKRYGKKSGSELVNILHSSSSPWSFYYEEGVNKEIPDRATKLYYDALIKRIVDNAKRRES